MSDLLNELKRNLVSAEEIGDKEWANALKARIADLEKPVKVAAAPAAAKAPAKKSTARKRTKTSAAAKKSAATKAAKKEN